MPGLQVRRDEDRAAGRESRPPLDSRLQVDPHRAGLLRALRLGNFGLEGLSRRGLVLVLVHGIFSFLARPV